MNGTPGTVSKILWHFTGGPKWDDDSNKQKDKPKPTEEAYGALISIIQSQQLRLGRYKEIIRAKLPQRTPIHPYAPNDELYVEHDTFREIQSMPVCCITDIPVIHLNYHAQRYGRMAIGFHRDSVTNNDFNPVQYLLDESTLLKMVYIGMNRIGTVFDDAATINPLSRPVDIPNTVNEFIATKHKDIGEQIEAALDISKDLADRIVVGAACMHNIVAHIKTFERSEFDSIYTEREWRSTRAFNFKFDDVSMVVVPRKDGYFKRLTNEADSLGLPRSVSIVPWEDLVEH